MRLLPGILLVATLASCGARPGSVRVTLTFENEARTRCVRVSVKAPNGVELNAVPSALDRAGDQLLVGIAETPELVGELSVTVARFEAQGCAGTAFATETRSVVLERGQEATLEFVFRGEAAADAGVDAGTGDDAGVPDAGACELATCPPPGECQVEALSCVSPGTCTFSPKSPGTACGDGGVCAGGACVADVCSVQPTGASCDDGLSCTTASACASGVCTPSQCAMAPPVCLRIRQPIVACDPVTPALCQLEPDPTQDNTACQGGTGRCLGGTCRPWLPAGFAPLYFDLPITQVPYPTDAWNLASPDGGSCAVVLNTGPAAPPFVEDGGCGLPAVTAGLSGDGGVALFTMTGLRVDPEVEVHFTGTRPAQLLVLGDATIDGLVSAAPQLGSPAAGAHPPQCPDAGIGTADDEGGGGGGFGAPGGAGSSNAGSGGPAASSLSTFRGGCNGGNGFHNGSFVAGGRAGGALELIVTGTLAVRNGGAVTASGGGGAAGGADKRGGGGGGSGGMVVLEANVLRVLDGGAVTANGGGGGEGGKNGETSAPGPFGSFTTAQRVANPGTSLGGGNGGRGGAGAGTEAMGEDGGTPGSGGNPGGGGGGGGVGVIYLRGRTSCTSTSSGGVLSGAQPEAIACP